MRNIVRQSNAGRKYKFYSQQSINIVGKAKKKTEDTPGTAVRPSWVQLVQGKPQRTKENQYSSTHQDTTDAVSPTVKNKSELHVSHEASDLNPHQLSVMHPVQTVTELSEVYHSAVLDLIF